MARSSTPCMLLALLLWSATSSCLGARLGGSSSTAGASGERMLGADKKLTFSFQTINNAKDLTFNQLLGINKGNVICGYFGNGTVPAHPNKGYTVTAPFGQAQFVDENFPGSVQTQVTGINSKGQTCGFFADAAGDNFGWTLMDGKFVTWVYPQTTGTVNQLLGLNDNGIAVGFFTDAQGNNHGYTLDTRSSKFTDVIPPNAVSTVASGINNAGHVSGFFTTASGATQSFLFKGGMFTVFSFPGSTNTQALGVNNNDAVVGVYVDGNNNMHGFLAQNLGQKKQQFQSLDDPNGVGTTTINGLNDKLSMVGFFVDGQGNTNGMLITPSS